MFKFLRNKKKVIIFGEATLIALIIPAVWWFTSEITGYSYYFSSYWKIIYIASFNFWFGATFALRKMGDE